MADPSRRPVVVVGAGPSGLSAAVALKDRGVAALVLEREDRVGSSWASRYDRLRLNTWRRYSHPPGRPYPAGVGTFPTRDDVVALIEGMASEDGVEVRLRTAVERIDRGAGGWSVRTSGGEVRAAHVVVATGYEQDPVLPRWPGREDFEGELLHAAGYRNAAPYRDRDVLVVGPGCTGMEIAYDLVEGGAARVRVAVRTPPNILLREGPAGIPGDVIACALWHLPVPVADAMARAARRADVGDLSAFGLDEPPEGVFTRVRRLGVAPSIVDREVLAAIRERRIEIVGAVEALTRDEVLLAGGGRLRPDAVICATGYRRALEPLVGHLGVLGERGIPRVVGGRPAAPGLWFIGYVPRPGGLGSMGREARRAARAIAGELRRDGGRPAARIPIRRARAREEMAAGAPNRAA